MAGWAGVRRPFGRLELGERELAGGRGQPHKRQARERKGPLRAPPWTVRGLHVSGARYDELLPDDGFRPYFSILW